MTNRKKINSTRLFLKLSLAFALLFLVFYACKKNNSTSTGTQCYCPDPLRQVDSSSVIGCWVLTDTLFYTKFSSDSIWVPINQNASVIKLVFDSSFCQDINFSWTYANYTQFKMIGNSLQLVPTENNGWITTITLAGNNELILDRTDATTGVKERFKRE